MKIEMSELVAAVKAHAIANYEKDGWDIVVECYSDADIARKIGGARSVKSAIAKVKNHMAPIAAYLEDIWGA